MAAERSGPRKCHGAPPKPSATPQHSKIQDLSRRKTPGIILQPRIEALQLRVQRPRELQRAQCFELLVAFTVELEHVPQIVCAWKAKAAVHVERYCVVNDFFS